MTVFTKEKLISVSLICCLVVIAGCGDVTPKRDHIPIIKNNLFKLQEAVKEHNRAAIDSLLSPKILEKQQSSDSLLNLVYGENYSFPFYQFGNAEIIYSTGKGRIDCYVMDSTGQKDRPLVFYLTYDDDLWLITGFAVNDSTNQM